MKLSDLDAQFGWKSFVLFIVIIIANMTTLILNANRMNVLKNDEKRRQTFDICNSIFIVGIPFLIVLFLWISFVYNGGGKWYGPLWFGISKENKNVETLNIIRYQTFWISLTIAILSLIFSNFVNSIRLVLESDENEETNSMSGIGIAFLSFGLFMGTITYIVTN